VQERHVEKPVHAALASIYRIETDGFVWSPSTPEQGDDVDRHGIQTGSEEAPSFVFVDGQLRSFIPSWNVQKARG
jgi:hypothetical protein